MTPPPEKYRRLPGRGNRLGGVAALVVARRTRLWLGSDHLLAVDSQWFTEEYRRYYFADIQSIVLRRTTTGRTISLALAVPTLLALIGAILGADEVRVGFAVITLVLGAILMVHIGQGPTSVCHLRTAVQLEEMPTLRRWRRARRVLDRLRPLILAAQEQLSPDTAAAAVAPSPAAPPPAAAAADPAVAPPSTPSAG